jgi:hypothetical protein
MSLLYVGYIKFLTNQFVRNFCPIDIYQLISCISYKPIYEDILPMPYGRDLENNFECRSEVDRYLLDGCEAYIID